MAGTFAAVLALACGFAPPPRAAPARWNARTVTMKDWSKREVRAMTPRASLRHDDAWMNEPSSHMPLFSRLFSSKAGTGARGAFFTVGTGV